MALIRWEPARELNSLFSSIFDTPTGSVSAGRRWLPAMDLVETDDHFVLRADLPGLSEDDVDVTLENDVLTVRGERRYPYGTEGQGVVRRVERAFGRFERTLRVLRGLDPNAIEAAMANGVLTLRLPKPESLKPHRIPIAGGDEQARPIEGSSS